ncbi:MAG: putative peptide modification system cyclase [Lysobacter sp.]
MNAQSSIATAPAAEPHGVPQLRTILLTDLVDSTALVERLGDGAAAELFRAHDRLVLRLQNEWRGRLIDRSDGLLLLFERPVDGLGFALDYARGLRELGAPHGTDIKARAGLHVGEVLSWRNSDEAVRLGAKPIEVEGLAKPMAGRLMAMARPGQLLMSAVAEPLAHRAARELGERGQHLLWKSHGRWRFKGVPETQQIFEVGEPGITPLRAPQPSPKAWRDIPLWRRPAALAVELALVAAIGLGIWFVTRPQPAIAFNQRDWVVLADLRNLTDQPLLDDSLEQAFRISLEQSRHVNVLSDLKTRDTLARMQRAPDTEIDRAIASEIAIRDGARAVILPTVAEIGGRVRVSAEVIDPNSQTTVYAEYADGKGAVSALASIDEVTAALREKLGEALEVVERDSAPLPEVATENLDALRAYAMGVAAYGDGAYDEALGYFKRAVSLDPTFALAYMGALRIRVSRGETPLAMSLLAQAVSHRERLPARDAFYLDAWSADLNPDGAQTAPEKWKLLAGMYPDYYAGHANYSAWAFELGDYGDALEYARAATVQQNPLRRMALEQVGQAELAMGQYRNALAAFKQAATDGRLPNRQMAAVYAAEGRFSEAAAVLSALPRDELTNNFERISIAVDQGSWDEALRISAEASSAVEDSSPAIASLFRTIDLSVRTLRDGDPPPASDYRRAIDAALADFDGAQSANPADRLLIALAATHLAQRAGHVGIAEEAIPRVSRLSKSVDHPRVDQMLVVVEANQQRLTGNAAGAVAQLQRLIDGKELFQVHVALCDALRTTGRGADAQEQARWLSAHRGLAYAERIGGYVLQAANVADTRTATATATRLQ